MPSSAPGTSSNIRLLFKPPSGGDLTLRSNDGVNFLVHSTVLKLASSVFDDMITTSNAKDIIQLAENASEVSYLLRFVYPNRFPVTFRLDDDLLGCLSVVQKYNIRGALEIIDELIAMNGFPDRPLSFNPIRVYQLAVQFNLTKTKIAFAPLVTASQMNFCDLRKLPQFTQTYSPQELVRMMNLQSMRSKVLSDILFDFKNKPMLPADIDFFYELSCGGCRPGSRHREQTEGCKTFPTTWSIAWARLVYGTLIDSPINRSSFLFEETILRTFTNDNYVCQNCLSRIQESYRPQFEAWITNVKESLETQLKRLELLYAI